MSCSAKEPYAYNGSMDTTYLLIGGGLTSNQAAKELRQHHREATITLVGAEPYVPYDRPPLSKEFMRGEKTSAQLFFDPEEYYRQQQIGLVLGTHVQRLDAANKVAFLSDGNSIRFEKALVATGGRPVHLPIPGADLPGVHYLRTLDDAARISAEARPGRRAVLIGGGFIGMELAASLTVRGVQATVVEASDHIWARFADSTLARAIQGYCEKKGVRFRTGDQVTEICGDGRPTSVKTASGEEVPCDFVCIGVGILPNVDLAQGAGLTVDNGIVVNEHLQTSNADVYAGGDVANYWDPLFVKRRRVEHWGHAEYCGQLAGQNMAGVRNTYDLLTYVWSDIFDLHLEFAGDESEHDEILLRGRFEDRSFTVLYLKQHVLTAYFAINPGGKDLPVLQNLIREKKNLSAKTAELQNPLVSLKTI
jgi:3-phenylpropionate/trans-cinnamate dioxygenase ferredoxin reductase subunit